MIETTLSLRNDIMLSGDVKSGEDIMFCCGMASGDATVEGDVIGAGGITCGDVTVGGDVMAAGDVTPFVELKSAWMFWKADWTSHGVGTTLNCDELTLNPE